MLLGLLFVSTLFLAYSNGANDNYKGVATLYGSGMLNYNRALLIATTSTFTGSICAIFLADGLIAGFSGKGLVLDEVAGSTHFLLAVASGAGCTVFIAALLGFPISTTHSLVGALVGAGLMAAGSELNLATLGTTFFVPLLLSPFIAFALGLTLYLIFNSLRKRLGLNKQTCICYGATGQFTPLPLATAASMQRSHNELVIADQAECREMYTDRIMGMTLQRIIDYAHIGSGVLVSFARGLNDTPKIAALLVGAHAFNLDMGMTVIALAMAVGGLLNARRVALTISKKITSISHGQGFCANLATALLVIIASKLGVPVSTTHVAVGSLFGISRISEQHNNQVIMQIILSWLATLPLAMTLSGLVYWLIA